jgi:hypothetical protein
VTATLTYVYCLVRSSRRPALRGVPDGVPGASAPRALDAGTGVWAIVATVPAPEYDEPALADGLKNLDWVGRRAIAHEGVVEHFLSAAAVLPMQLFTLFTADERALEHVRRDRTRINRILRRLEGQLEWGLRLTFDEKSALTDSAERRKPSGSAYLARKRDQLDLARVRLTEARADANRLYRAMSREATEARRRPSIDAAAPGSRLLLDAAFLAPRGRSAAFRSALRRNARKLGARGIVVSLTGPWPPYNFIASPRSRRP